MPNPELIALVRIPWWVRLTVRIAARLADWHLVARYDAYLFCDWLIWRAMEVKTK